MSGKTRKVNINGTDYQVPAWTVGERRKVVARFNEIALLKGEEAQTEALVKLIAEQMGMTIEQAEEMDAATFDELAGKMVETNRGPLAPKVS